MPIKLICFLAVGTIAMLVPIVFVSKIHGIKRWKSVIVSVMLTVVGTIGTYFMYYIENQKWGGLSFYGAVFLVPIVFAVISPLLCVSYGKIMDLCAIGECIMLALMKVHCIISGCCVGRELFTTADGDIIRFPSRTAEMIVALVIFIVLLRWSKQTSKRGYLYAWYLVLYGGSRFVLNFGREAWQNWNGTVPVGTIWSICAVMIGVAVLLMLRKKQL